MKKIGIMVIYNYLLLKLFAPPSIYRLQELGWNDTVIEYFYMICEALRFTAPILLQILITVLPVSIHKKNNSNKEEQ